MAVLLEATLGMWAPSERVLEAATFWDRVRKALGPKREARPEEVRTLLSAAALVGGAAQALESLGVTNAIALEVDGARVFEDRQGRPDDLDLLVEAVAKAPPGDGLRTLELTVEHRDADLHYAVGLSARGVHATDDATGLVTVSARILALVPRDGELELDFHERLSRELATSLPIEASVATFRRFVERLSRALALALPDVRVGAPTIDVRVRRPGPSGAVGAVGGPAPAPLIDRYVPEPRQALASEALWAQVRRWSWSPAWPVVDASGRRIGSLAAFAAEAKTTEPFAAADAWTWDAWAGAWGDPDAAADDPGGP